MTEYKFPDGFLWGAGTSGYQVEGSPLADGAGSSIQHRYAHTPGTTFRGDNGDVAADHYRRFAEDIAIMRDLGLQSYQFSIPWPRIRPEGTGRVNQAGLDHYDRMIDTLVDSGVRPAPILYVWDLPGALQDRGGWANRDSADWFADYAATLFDAYGDRATHWFTVCEPDVVSLVSHAEGGMAPAMRDLYAACRAVHHVLLGHGRAVQAFRASDATGVIGTSTGVTDIQPASDAPADVAAADLADAYQNWLFLDPVIRGEYPAEIVRRFGAAWPEIPDADLADISASVDFLGFTYYCSFLVAAGAEPGSDSDEPSLDSLEGPELTAAISRQAGGRDLMGTLLNVRVVPGEGPYNSGFGIPFRPDGLRAVLRRLRDRYGNLPLYVTELGAAFPDTVGPDGRVDDPRRIAYLHDHLKAAHQAIADGVDLRGCFVWSFLDTWEFFLGYFSRFGLVHVDYKTQRRTVKESGRWYAEVMAENGF